VFGPGDALPRHDVRDALSGILMPNGRATYMPVIKKTCLAGNVVVQNSTAESVFLRLRLTSTRQSLDTGGSALTGRHQPAAREHSHLFALSRVRRTFFQPGFSGAQAIHERRSQ
jgi:hypothetical protein